MSKQTKNHSRKSEKEFLHDLANIATALSFFVEDTHDHLDQKHATELLTLTERLQKEITDYSL